MKRTEIELAITESMRFIEKAQHALSFDKHDHDVHYGNGAANGAMKRASLDASRALADMRKSKH